MALGFAFGIHIDLWPWPLEKGPKAMNLVFGTRIDPWLSSDPWPWPSSDPWP